MTEVNSCPCGEGFIGADGRCGACGSPDECEPALVVGTCWRCGRTEQETLSVPAGTLVQRWCVKCCLDVAKLPPAYAGGQGHSAQEVEEAGGSLLVVFTIACIVAVALVVATFGLGWLQKFEN